MNSAAEKKLIRRVCERDPDAFQQLYETYSRSVYNRCLQLSRSPSTAEDLTQEVFLQVWRKISGFRGESRLATWIFKVATNTALLHLRRRRSHTEFQPHSLHDEGDAFEQCLPAPESELEDRLLIREVLPMLPPAQQLVLMLHEIEGYKHSEISEILHIPAGTSKSNLSRGRSKIRSILLCSAPDTHETSLVA